MRPSLPNEKSSKKAGVPSTTWLYRLTIKIHRGENLPIADITTSDPYVIVKLGDHNIGRTQTIYRNRDPVWEATFSDIYLTHLDQSIHLRVNDDDRNKNDDYLGDIFVPLRSKEISFNKVEELNRKLQQIEGNKIIASGSISFSIFLEKNSSVISLKSNSSSSNTYNPLMHPIVEDELLRVNAPEAVLMVLKSWQGNYISIDERSYLRDLLLDVCSIDDHVKLSRNIKALKSFDSSASMTIVPMHVKKPIENLLPNRATVYNMRTGNIHVVNSSKDIRLTLIMTNNDHHIIVFSSNYQLWMCSRAIRYAAEVLRGKAGHHLPEWISDGELLLKDVIVYSHSYAPNSVPYIECKGILFLSLNVSPISLTVKTESKGTVFSVDIMTIECIALSRDYSFPRKFLAQIEVCKVILSDQGPDGSLDKKSVVYDPHYQFSANALPSHVQDRQPGPDSRSGPPVVSAGSGFCFGLLCGTFKLTTNAAHAAVATVGAVQDVVNTVAEALTDYYQVVVRGYRCNYRTNDRLFGPEIEWDESVYIDMDLNSNALDMTYNLSSTSSQPGTFVADDQAGVYIFLFRKRSVGAQDSLLGSKFVNMKDYLLQDRRNGKIDLSLNDNISFNITVTSIILYTSDAAGLPALDPSTKYSMVCRFADGSGGKVRKHRLSKTIPKSSITSDKSGIQFNCQDLNFCLSCQDGLEGAAYVRFDILIENGSLSEEKVASGYIPIETFTSSLVDVSVAMSNINCNIQLANKNWSKGLIAKNGVYGMFTASISREITIRQPIGSSTQDPIPNICLKYNMEEQNIFSSFWPSEAVLLSDFTADKYLFAPAYDGILLLDATDPALRHGHQIRLNSAGIAIDESIDFDSYRDLTDASVFHGNSRESSHTDLGDEIEVVVLENERNALTNFKKENLLLNDFAPFSDEHGNAVAKVSRLTDILPPYGYYWENDWCVDTHFFDPNVDRHGWKYGPDFKSITQRTKKKLTILNKAVELVRSRRWIRRARRSHAEKKSDPSIRDMNQNFVYLAYSSNSMSPQSQSRFDWRETILHDNPNKILACCKERSSISSGVRIPYEQILSYELVSDTILSIQVQVQRYLGKTAFGEESFRPVTLELFVESCPALELKLLLNERREFYNLRKNLAKVFEDERDAMINHRVANVHMNRQASLMQSLSKLSYDVSPPGSPGRKANDVGPPATLDISPGCLALQDIDRIELTLQQAIKSNANASGQDKRILEQRLFRIQMYHGLLLGVVGRLTDKSKYEEERVLRSIQNDFVICESIDGENEIEASVHRLEYLFDTAESNILDYSLRGYMHYTTGALHSTLHLLINEYFVAIVSTIGKYFESRSESQTYLKGLQQKIYILLAFMKYNDRLETVASTALRFYRFEYDPVPRLSAVLKINVLIALYTNVLQEDMTEAVNKVMRVWKDVGKNASGNLEFYNHSLPWIPMRSNHRDGFFYTSIPKETVDYLLDYVVLACLGEDDIAPSFRPLAAIIESRVNFYFSSSLKYLCDTYWQTLLQYWPQWTDKSKIQVLLKETLLPSIVQATSESSTKTAKVESEEDKIFRFLDEKIDWICSLANDAYRIISSNLISNPPSRNRESSPNSLSLAELCPDLDFSDSQSSQEFQPRIESLLNDTKLSFKHLISLSVDALSSPMMLQLSIVNDSLFNTAEFYQEWKRQIPLHSSHDDYEKNSKGSINFPRSEFLSQFIDNLVDRIKNLKDYLMPSCYLRFIEICVDKCIGMFYWLILEANDSHVRWTWHHPEVTQLYHDVKHLRNTFDSIEMPLAETGPSIDVMAGIELNDLVATKNTMIESRMMVLEHMIMLLRLKKVTKRSIQAIFEPILVVAPRRRAVVEDIAALLKLTVSMRLDVDWMTTEEKQMHDNRHLPQAAPRRSFLSFLKSDTHSTPDGNRNQSSDTPEKSNEKRRSGRGSILSALGFGSHERSPSISTNISTPNPSAAIPGSDLTQLRYEIAQTDAALAARAEYETPETIALEDEDSSDESVDFDIVVSYISSVSASKIRSDLDYGIAIANQDQDVTSNACSKVVGEDKFSHMQYYLCAEARIPVYHMKKDSLLRTSHMKSFIQANLILPAHQPLSREEERDSFVEPKSRKSGIQVDKQQHLSAIASLASEDELQYFIEIGGLYITDLFFVDSSYEVYVSFDLNVDDDMKWRYHVKSSLKHNSISPDWRSEPPRQIPVHQNIPVEYAKSHPVQEILRAVLSVPLICTVRLKGHFYGKTDIGTFKVNISSLDINPIQDEYGLDISSSDAKIQKAAAKALALPGSSPPKVGLTVNLVTRNTAEK